MLVRGRLERICIRLRAKENALLTAARQSVKKSIILIFYASCGSTHKIEFAKQIHKFREHVSRNLYKGRKNVSVGRGFSSRFARKRGFEREAVRKTKFFDSLRGTPFRCASVHFPQIFLFAGADGVPCTSATNILQHGRGHLCVDCTDQVLINVLALVQIKVFDRLSVKAG